MPDYSKWPDDELLEEADERRLNSTEATMLESMHKWCEGEGKDLTPKQRAWLVKLLDEREEDHGGDDD